MEKNVLIHLAHDADLPTDCTVTKGKFKLTNLRKLEWSRLVLLPGILDAATRLELRSNMDLHTRQPTAEVKLGLRRKTASSGLGLVHSVALDWLPGGSLDIGAMVTLPSELRLGTAEGAGLRELARAMRVEVDIETLCLDLQLDEMWTAVTEPRATSSASSKSS